MSRADVLRGAYGTFLLVAPSRALRLGGSAPTSGSRLWVRILGARHLVQAVIGARWPAPLVRPVGAAVDATHAVTDIACAAVKRRYRLAALLDALVAVGFVAHAAASRRAEPT